MGHFTQKLSETRLLGRGQQLEGFLRYLTSDEFSRLNHLPAFGGQGKKLAAPIGRIGGDPNNPRALMRDTTPLMVAESISSASTRSAWLHSPQRQIRDSVANCVCVKFATICDMKIAVWCSNTTLNRKPICSSTKYSCASEAAADPRSRVLVARWPPSVPVKLPPRPAANSPSSISLRRRDLEPLSLISIPGQVGLQHARSADELYVSRAARPFAR